MSSHALRLPFLLPILNRMSRVGIQYSMAVLLICSSIALAFLNEQRLGNIANGVLMYIAQAFLLAGSIFGLEYYVKKLTNEITKRNQK